MIEICVFITPLNDRGENSVKALYEEEPTLREKILLRAKGIKYSKNLISKDGAARCLEISFRIEGSAEPKSLQEAIKNYTEINLARKGSYPEDNDIRVVVE